MDVRTMPVPIAGAAPVQQPKLEDGIAPAPAAKPTPNPYAIPDSIVTERARDEADRENEDLRAAAEKFWNAAIGDDLRAATDPNRSSGERLLHAGLAGATILTLPGASEALGLKLVVKETLKGGVEQLTFHAVGKGARVGGKLLLKDGVKLTPDEAKIAGEFARRGHEVIASAPSRVGKSADFLIDGKPPELKTISHVAPDSAGRAVTQTIKNATRQAKNVVIDARGQRGLTETTARSAVKRALDELPASRIGRIEFLGRDGNRLYEFVETKK